MKTRDNGSKAFALDLKRIEITAIVALLLLLTSVTLASALTPPLPDDYGSTIGEDYPARCPNLYSTIQKGSRNQGEADIQVEELQLFLSGYYDVDPTEIVTGYFGSVTHSFVVRFQREQGLPSFGIVGSLTRAKIASVCGGNTLGNFSASPTSGAAPLAVQFTVGGNGGIYTVDFGDGSAQASVNTIISQPWVTHIYSTVGTYTAKLETSGGPNAGVCPAPGWPNYGDPNCGVIGTATITVGGEAGKCGANTFSVYNECEAGAFRNAYVQCYDGHQETLGGPTSCKPSETWRTYANDVCAKRCSPASSITVTAPNGGEQWEVGTMNTITWTPYGYSPDINPANDVTAYLEGKGGSGGKIVPSGKASIHWEGEIIASTNDRQMFAEPGEYYIRVVNNKTGESDRSDAPFTLLPKPVDLKVNGSDGPISVDISNPVTLSWTAKSVDRCEIHNAYTDASRQQQIGSAPLSGSLKAYLHEWGPTLYCYRSNGTNVSDSVSINVKSGSTSVQVISPNGGEQWQWDQSLPITWNQKGLSSVSVALYRNDQWYKWLFKDVTHDKAANDSYSLVWNPAGADVEVGKNIYKIYITGQRADGTGYVDDKSDRPFSFTSGTDGASFSASPTSGAAPLAVMFSTNQSSGTIDFGDGTSGPVRAIGASMCALGSDSCPSSNLYGADHTYKLPGTYTAKLRKAWTCNAPPGAACNAPPPEVLGTVTVAATARSVSSVVSDTSWKASTREERGWRDVGFNDSAWAAAVDEGPVNIWLWETWTPHFPSGSSARWIWNYNSKSGGDTTTVLFRKTFVPSESHMMLYIASDNMYNIAVNGQIVSHSEWNPGVVQVALVPGEINVIAAEVVNQGGPGGLLVDLRQMKSMALSSGANSTQLASALAALEAGLKLLISKLGSL